jgi:transcriptional regulator with XRE-family HTH domain
MNDERAQQLGEFVRHQRTEQDKTTRELATEAGIDRGGLTRLEQGKVQSPRPDTLCALALALHMPFADMFARAGYTVPQELPSVESYLRTKYACLPEDETLAITKIVEQLATLHGWEPQDNDPGQQ